MWQDINENIIYHKIVSASSLHSSGNFVFSTVLVGK